MTDKAQLIKEEIRKRIKVRNQWINEEKDASDLQVKTWQTLNGEDESILRFIDSIPEEPANEDLEEAAEKYAYNEYPSIGIPNTVTELAFKAGAEWQLNQMKEILRTEYEKGRFDMREEMMKDAVLETKVMMDCDGDGIETPYEEWLTLENTEIPYIPDNLGLKEGDKVKIIIVKED